MNIAFLIIGIILIVLLTINCNNQIGIARNQVKMGDLLKQIRDKIK